MKFDANFRYIFKDLNKITSDLKNKELSSLIEWCKTDNISKELALMNSSLYFESIKLNVSNNFVVCLWLYIYLSICSMWLH